MELTDEEIASILDASDVEPENFIEILHAAGVEPTGEAARDVRALAEAWDIEPSLLLYGFFAEDSPLFVDNDHLVGPLELFDDDDDDEEEW